MDDTDKKTGSFYLCQKSFCALFGFKRDKLKAMQKRALDPNRCVLVEVKKNISKQAADKQIVHDNLAAVLETEPR